LLFGKDAMGDGDIKMMRGIGALLGPLLLTANVSIAVVLGIFGGVAGMIVARSQAKKGQQESPQPQEDESPYVPTPVWVVIASGAWYLFCLDVVSLFVKPLDRWIVSKFPQETVEEDDNWKPSVTTIPFGPYLAAGAIVCMLFGPTLESSILDYWKRQTAVSPPVGTFVKRQSTSIADIFQSPSTIFEKVSSHATQPTETCGTLFPDSAIHRKLI
jgi:leader peptidase (prepilin peptidase)/N-methyltransferase